MESISDRVCLLACLLAVGHAQLLRNGSLPGGSISSGPISGGSSSGGSGGIGGGVLPPFPNSQPPAAVHHVGVGYNLLKGNPDGEYWSTGGEDPGLLLTRRVLMVSPFNSKHELQMEHHEGCQNSHGFTLFYNTKSYQDKLYKNVQTSGAADQSLRPYGFTLSSAFQAVTQQTSKHHYVYQDSASYCQLGHVRYAMNLAQTDKFPVSREFAADVCKLPATYDSMTYMKFIDDWGTHIMTEATIGKSLTYRYLARLRDLFNFVMFNVTDEISMGGAMNGYPESYVIDLNSFKYRHEYKYIFGTFEDILSVGDAYTSDIIGKSLVTIDTALDPKFWQWMTYFQSQNLCGPNASSMLSTWQKNIIQALKDYPTLKHASAPADAALAMPVTWPLGTYSLPEPKTDCPKGFVEGQVIIPQSYHSSANASNTHLDGMVTGDNYTLDFCTKEHPYPTDYDIYWPRGDYCIFQYDSLCPYPFKYGSMRLHARKPATTSGTVPTGTYNTVYPELRFCCRNDTVYTQKMYLPNDKPFYLLRFQHGCQQIAGMTSTDETVSFYNELLVTGNNVQTALEGSHPYVEKVGTTSNGSWQYKLHYCYYTPITK